MVEASWVEIVITSVMIMAVAGVLRFTGYLEEGITVFVFMTMGLLGFLTVRVIRGRKLDWR